MSPQQTAPTPVYVTIDEAGKSLGVSRNTVRRLIRSGELEARKIGKSVRIPVSSLENAGKPLAVAGAR